MNKLLLITLIGVFIAIAASKSTHNIEKRQNHGCKATILRVNEYINEGECLNSPNHDYILRMQHDGNLVMYGGDDYKSPVWKSDTTNRGNGPYWAKMRADGNLVIYASGEAIWDSDSNRGSGQHYELRMQDDGNLVVYQAIWASKKHV